MCQCLINSLTAKRGPSNWQISYMIEDKDVLHNMTTQFLPKCFSKNADSNTSTNLLVDLSTGFVDILHALPRMHFFVDMTWITCLSCSCCLIRMHRDRSCNHLSTLSPYNLFSIALNLYEHSVAVIAWITRWVLQQQSVAIPSNGSSKLLYFPSIGYTITSLMRNGVKRVIHFGYNSSNAVITTRYTLPLVQILLLQ